MCFQWQDSSGSILIWYETVVICSRRQTHCHLEHGLWKNRSKLSALEIDNTRCMSFDIKFIRLVFENTCWIAMLCQAIQHVFSKLRYQKMPTLYSIYHLTLQTSDYDVKTQVNRGHQPVNKDQAPESQEASVYRNWPLNNSHLSTKVRMFCSCVWPLFTG